MANGILIVDKPAGWTSMDVCAKLRGKFREKRVGHGGTLDPMATGILPVFFGRATRGVEYATDSQKEYIAGLKLGVITNTQDITGEVLERRPVSVCREELLSQLSSFTGELAQIPPMYSAIKRDGQKLYELARKGIEVARPPRPVTIYQLELLQTPPFDWQEEEDLWFLRVRCSKGTYIRTLCHDLGMALGCGGCMAALRRTEAGGATLSQSVTLDEVLGAEEPEQLLSPVDTLFVRHPAFTVDRREETRAKNGNPFPLACPDGMVRVYGPEGAFLLLGQVRGGICTTVKSFFEV